MADYFGIAGTDSLGPGYSAGDGYGLTLAEAADAANGSYDYVSPLVWSTDAAEQSRMGTYYPPGSPWYVQAAASGVSRGVDSPVNVNGVMGALNGAVKAWATVKGVQAATYAGQNGLTYVNGRTGQQVSISGGLGPLLPMLLIGGALLLLMK